MIFLFYFWEHFHEHVYLFKQLLVVVEYDKNVLILIPPSLSHTHTQNNHAKEFLPFVEKVRVVWREAPDVRVFFVTFQTKSSFIFFCTCFREKIF